MKKYLLILALFSIALVASANEIDLQGLTPGSMNELQKHANILRQEQAGALTTSEVTRKEAEAWGRLGANMGKALIGAAKEIGVASNEFVQTPLGKVTAAVVVYKLIGRDVLKIVFGTFTLIVGTLISLWLMVTYRLYSCTFVIKPYLFGLWNRRIVADVKMDEGTATAKILIGASILAITWLVGLNIIF